MSEENRTNTLQLKEELVAKETSLFQAQSIIAELRKDLEQAREEVKSSIAVDNLRLNQSLDEYIARYSTPRMY